MVGGIVEWMENPGSSTVPVAHTHAQCATNWPGLLVLLSLGFILPCLLGRRVRKLLDFLSFTQVMTEHMDR